MAKKEESYWSKHHWGIIQGATGMYCAGFATWEYFYPRSVSSPLPKGGLPVTSSYVMPLWLWLGIVSLVLSVLIPAILNIARRKNKQAELQDIKISAGQAVLLWHFSAQAKDLVRMLEGTWHRITGVAQENR